jgi:hypothetical protein
MMRTTELIQLLQAAYYVFGDVPIVLMNEETGDWCPIGEVLKLHPYTGKHGCMNRGEPVNAIAMTRGRGNWADLVLSSGQDHHPEGSE